MKKSIRDFFIIWFGIYQAIHVAVNMYGLHEILNSRVPFPIFPPREGWTRQAIHFLTGIAIIDVVNAFASLVFVYAFFKGIWWWKWLGSITLTASINSAFIFNYATIASRAWENNLFSYLAIINLPYVPVFILFFLIIPDGKNLKH